jgi:prepilin-type N-terminal cleavage/methylation domain-containing protein
MVGYNQGMKSHQHGFTLIELLVVITIIGLLASIVLVSLTSARNKSKDARTISDVRQVVLTLGSGWNGTAYPDLKNNANAGAAATGNASCTTNSWNASGPKFTQMDLAMGDICQQLTNGYSVAIVGNQASAAGVNAFAIYGPLLANSGKFYCMDSLGNVNPAATTNTGYFCP